MLLGLERTAASRGLHAIAPRFRPLRHHWVTPVRACSNYQAGGPGSVKGPELDRLASSFMRITRKRYQSALAGSSARETPVDLKWIRTGASLIDTPTRTHPPRARIIAKEALIQFTGVSSFPQGLKPASF